MCLVLWASALSAQTHWSFNYRQYQYDMSVYFSLQLDRQVVANTSDYEVAAFVGEECRGIGSFEQQTGANGQQISYGFLKVYSNSQSGETITLKVYDKVNQVEIVFDEKSFSFVSSSVKGYPSKPMVLNMGEDVLKGDVNDDDEVDLTDVVLIYEFYMGEELTGFIEDAADFNGDDKIDLTDVELVFEYFMNQ